MATAKVVEVSVTGVKKTGSSNTRMIIQHPDTSEEWTVLVPTSDGVQSGDMIRVIFPEGETSPGYSYRQATYMGAVERVSDDGEDEGVTYRYLWRGWADSVTSASDNFETVDDVMAGVKAFEEPGYLYDLEQLILFGKPVLLVGPAGIGKSVGIQYLAEKHGKPLYRVNFDGGMTPDSFIGGVRVKADGASGSATFFQNGPVVEAAVQGGWLLLDELDKAQPEYAAALHAMLESIRNPIVLNDDGGRQVVPADGFRIIATANTLGDVEDAALGFFGSSPMNAAFKDRFSIFRVTYPETEASILAKVFPNSEFIGKLLKVAEHVRDSSSSGFSSKLGAALSTRRLVSFLSTFRLFILRENLPRSDPDQRNHLLNAIRYEITSRLSSEDSNLVMQFFQDVFGQRMFAETPERIGGGERAPKDTEEPKVQHISPEELFSSPVSRVTRPRLATTTPSPEILPEKGTVEVEAGDVALSERFKASLAKGSVGKARKGASKEEEEILEKLFSGDTVKTSGSSSEVSGEDSDDDSDKDD